MYFFLTQNNSAQVINNGVPNVSDSDLDLWLNANAISGLSNGSSVSTWNDASTAGNNLTQSATERPTWQRDVLNGNASVRFDGFNDSLISANATLNQSHTIFYVANISSITTGANASVFQYAPSVSGVSVVESVVFQANASIRRLRMQMNGIDTFATAPNNTTSLYSTFVGTQIRNGNSDLRSYINNQLNQSVTTPSTDFTTTNMKFRLGTHTSSGQNLNGDIFEVLIYNRALTDSEINQVNSYLLVKYLFSISTPASLSVPNYQSGTMTTQTFLIDGASGGSGSGSFSQINASGAVVLSGGTLKPQTQFTSSSNFAPVYGQKFTLIRGSSVTGSYASVDSSANPGSLRFVAEYTGTEVNVYATPGDYARDVSNLSASEQSLGKALNGIVTTSVDQRLTDRSAREVLTAGLMKLTTQELKGALVAMDPVNLESMTQTVLQGSQALQSGFTSRIDQLQAGSSGGMTLNGMSLTDLEGNYDYEPIASLEVPYVLKRKEHLWSYWINGTGSWGEVEREAQKSGYQFYGMGSQVGMDHTFKNGWTAGLMLWEGYTKTSLRLQDSIMESHRGGGGIYGHREWRGLYWGGYAGAGKLFYETDRSLGFLGERSQGSTEGVVLQGSSELGYEMRWRNWGFGPTGSLAYDRVMNDRYQEKGSAASLEIADQVQESLRHQLGVRIQSFWKWSGIGFQPSLRLSWGHEYLDPRKIQSRFLAGGNWFSSETRKLDPESMNTRVGLTVTPDDHWSVTASYQTELLNQSYSAHQLDLGVRYGF